MDFNNENNLREYADEVETPPDRSALVYVLQDAQLELMSLPGGHGVLIDLIQQHIDSIKVIEEMLSADEESPLEQMDIIIDRFGFEVN